MATGYLRWGAFPLERDVILICLFWNLYNLAIVLLCLGRPGSCTSGAAITGW